MDFALVSVVTEIIITWESRLRAIIAKPWHLRQSKLKEFRKKILKSFVKILKITWVRFFVINPEKWHRRESFDGWKALKHLDGWSIVARQKLNWDDRKTGAFVFFGRMAKTIYNFSLRTKDNEKALSFSNRSTSQILTLSELELNSRNWSLQPFLHGYS